MKHNQLGFRIRNSVNFKSQFHFEQFINSIELSWRCNVFYGKFLENTVKRQFFVTIELHQQSELSAKPTNLVQHLQPLSKQGYAFEIVRSTDLLNENWTLAAPSDNGFLHIPFLSAVEEAPPKGMRFTYLVFYKNEIPVGVAYCQITPFSVGESVNTEDDKDKYPCLVRAFGRMVRNIVSGKNRNLLVCGNLLLTGEHGFYFPPEIGKSAAFDMLEEALIITQNALESQGINIDGIFIKDISEEHRAPVQVLMDRKFSEFTFHPNMVLHLRENWKTFEDYMDDISSKYKVRARKAFKCLDGMEVRELSEAEIFDNQEKLYALYSKVASNQDFNMVSLNSAYMPALKLHLGEHFRVHGYFLNGEMVGYFTTIKNHHELEAHFLGFDPEYNKEYHLYHNILFHILKLGLEAQVKNIVYARTAMEIKSTIGAKAYQMLCYIRASNKLTNKVLPPIVEYLKPSTDWVARNPFKDEN